ncbi:hypothetical protein MAM1_0006d00793 [Mucor ambiguus]|uniref:Nudix hydrolase domain-containing protein n=1 Tax=Mucor ambiguus TaxID=91626 RepID=A0A0C9LQA7_9FUNG|nr:hypothetical protein MAM1_0006d00793 [Mucor ambiguus]
MTEYRSVAGIAVYREPILQETQQDTSNDLHDMYREPGQRLYLLVKKPRIDHSWQFPQGGLKKKGNETVAQGALRELSEECGSDLVVDLIDTDAPFCIYQYPFPPEFIKSKKKKKQYAGAKVQFVRAKWTRGQCRPDGHEIVDFAWLTSKEMLEFVSPDYAAGIQALVSDDTPI